MSHIDIINSLDYNSQCNLFLGLTEKQRISRTNILLLLMNKVREQNKTTYLNSTQVEAERQQKLIKQSVFIGDEEKTVAEIISFLSDKYNEDFPKKRVTNYLAKLKINQIRKWFGTKNVRLYQTELI